CFNPGVAVCGTGPMTAYVILPVHLINFTGERINTTANRLHWTTAQEQNSAGYYIQRSGDGVSFNDIAFVKSSGNSNTTLNYSYNDNTAGLQEWYYKLRMVDRDGHEDHSATIFIEGDKTTAWKVWSDEQGNKIH